MILHDFNESRDLEFDFTKWEGMTPDTQVKFITVFNEIKRQTTILQTCQTMADKGLIKIEGPDTRAAIEENLAALAVIEAAGIQLITVEQITEEI